MRMVSQHCGSEQDCHQCLTTIGAADTNTPTAVQTITEARLSVHTQLVQIHHTAATAAAAAEC